MPKQKYGRPSTGQKGNNRPTVVISRENYDEIDSLSIGTGMTGQKGNNRPTVVISRENYDEIDSLSIGTGMSRSAIIDYFISEGLKKARIEEVVIKTKRLVLED